MKGSVIVFVIGRGLLQSGPSWCEDFHLTVGYKLWYSQWEMRLGGEAISSDFELIQAPALGLRWGRIFAGAALINGGVDFPLKKGLELRNPGSPGEVIRNLKGKADLIQLETGVGYYVTPSFGPYIGYLSQNQEFEFDTNLGSFTGEQDLGTALIGVLWNRPTFGPRTAFYANGALVGLFGGDVRGGVAEVGVAYAAQRTPVSFSSGFKYQDFRYQKDISSLNGNPRERDTFLGLTLGIHFTL